MKVDDSIALLDMRCQSMKLEGAVVNYESDGLS